LFLSQTYAVFLDSEISDPIEREAVKTMVKTYGQMPRQLFKSPHPATKALDYSLVDKPIVSTVRGLLTRHYVKLELLLVLANQRSCAVRQAIIQLLSVLTKRLASGELNAATKLMYPLHLANQLTIHGCDTGMFEACLAWISGMHGSLTDVLSGETPLRIRQRFGLQSLLAIAEGAEPQRVFKALLRLYLQVS